MQSKYLYEDTYSIIHVEKHGDARPDRYIFFLRMSIESPLNERYYDGKLGFTLGQRPDVDIYY